MKAYLKEMFENGTVMPYIVGLILSLILTLSAYFLVKEQVFTKGPLIFAITTLGITQMVVQLLFFLHIGDESTPHWNLFAFLFMALVVVIIVFGSLWIMYNLNDRVMPKMKTHEKPHKAI